MPEKEKFVMPMFPSIETSNVSTTSRDMFEGFASILGDKLNESLKFMQDLLIGINDQVQVLVKVKIVDHCYSTLVHRLRQHLHCNLYMVCRRTTSLVVGVFTASLPRDTLR